MNMRFGLKIKINMKIESFARKMNEQEIEPSLSTASNVYDWFMRWWIFLNRTNFPLFLTHSTDLVTLTVNEMKQRNKEEESLNQLIRQFIFEAMIFLTTHLRVSECWTSTKSTRNLITSRESVAVAYAINLWNMYVSMTYKRMWGT